MRGLARIFSYYYSTSNRGEALTAPSPLMSWSKDTTTANLQWNDPGADTYVLQRATDSNYSDATQIYSGSDSDYADSGLTIGTTYYYRIKAQKTGYSDSDWVTSSVTTIMVMPDFWYEITGMKTGVDNDYGTTETTTSKVDTVLPIINTDAETLTAGAIKAALENQDFTTPYVTFKANASNYYQAATPYTFSGNFTFGFRFVKNGTINNGLILANSADVNSYLRFNSSTQIRIVISGSGVTLTFPAITDYKWYDAYIKRDGTTLSLSLDGGSTFPYTGVVSSGDFVFDQFFKNIGILYQRKVGFSSAVSDAVLQQVSNYLKQPDYIETEAIASPAFTGITWSAHSGDYIVNTSFAINVLASYIRDRIINIGDYTIISGNTRTTDPEFSNDFVVIKKRSTGEISDIKYLGVPRSIVDDHNNGGIFIDDNRIKHCEMDSHYDSNTPQPTSLIIKEFGNEYDFTSFIQRTLANGVASSINSTTQYYLFHRFSNIKKAFFFQHWNGVAPANAQYTGILISTDNLNSFQRELIVDMGDTPWVYHNPLYSPDGVPRLILNIENKAGGARDGLYDYIFYIENPSKDGVTWTNKAGTFSQDISNFNPISLANLIANCLVQDASALTGNARVSWAFYDDSDGEIHGICGDGDDTGLQMFYWDGAAWVFVDIDPGTKTLVYDMRIGNGDNAPILIRTGPNSYDAYVNEENGGNWKIIKKSTTDKGVTWTDGTDFSSDDTHQHRRMHVNRDALYNDHITIGAARVVVDGVPTVDNSDIFIKDV